MKTSNLSGYLLYKFIPEMCKKAGISLFKTNHSLRATLATSLYEKGVDEQLIMEHTGHKSVDGKYSMLILKY